jgi:glutathione reductase (NADPH)
MPTRNFDVVILGGGNGGMGVTVPTREAGLSVAMMEPNCSAAPAPTGAACQKKCSLRRRMHSTRSSAPRRITSRSVTEP